jgi:uncharacterized membrane protein YagU involved in acid resistance
MMKALPSPRLIAGSIVAGVVGSVTIVACIAALNFLFHTPDFSLANLFAFDASVLVGETAYSGGPYVALGVMLHALVSLGWATGYVYLADRLPQLVTRPFTSGAAFGLIVYFAMQLVIVAANLYRIPTPGELAIALLAHLGFFGTPVALVAARFQPA